MRPTITRRRLVTGLAAAAALFGAATTPARAEITLEFVVWNYSIDTIQKNVARFEELNPGIKVHLTDYAWNDYHDTLVLRLKGGTPTDVIYVANEWLPEWAASGWLAPIEDFYPDIRKYADKTMPYALRDLTYNGKMYGLNYYAQTQAFFYNKKILADNSIAVPQTWDDVLQASLALQKVGIEKPFIWEFNAEAPNFYGLFVTQVYGRGGRMFDDDLNPVFNNPDSEARKQLQWLQDANTKYGIMATEPFEARVNVAMQTGKHVFTVLNDYNLAAMNNPASGARAGEFALAMMPGDTHEAVGLGHFYGMTQQAADDSERREATWKLIEFFGGGDYSVAKGWALNQGLGFAHLPLFDDPEIRASWSKWIDMDTYRAQAAVARNEPQTEWTGLWRNYFRPLLAKAIVGDATVSEVMEDGAAKWLEYRQLIRGE